MIKIPVAEAVGMPLCHDITRIIPGKEKGRAFQRGHVITKDDIPKLLDIGKQHIYVWKPKADLIHEDEAALRLAQSSAGNGVIYNKPNQGRVNLQAAYDGLLKVRVNQLNAVNSLDDVIMSTIHDNTVVKKGQNIAGTRITPLTVKKDLLEEGEQLCCQPEPLLSVKPFQQLWVGIITTGSEIYSGRIKDKFGPVVRQKIASFGSNVISQVIVPDDPDLIAQEIRRFINEGINMVLLTGGMSVDPDDVTPTGIRLSGADVVFYGTPILPGSMFMMGYLGNVPICGLPGCVMFHKATVFDLILPRILAGDRVQRADIVSLGHGGFCQSCETCIYPMCPFGKAPGVYSE